MKSGWPLKRVSEIATHSLGKMLDKTKNRGEPKPYLRNFNVRWFNFDLSDVQEMRFLKEEQDRYSVVKGDLVTRGEVKVFERGAHGKFSGFDAVDGFPLLAVIGFRLQ